MNEFHIKARHEGKLYHVEFWWSTDLRWNGYYEYFPTELVLQWINKEFAK